jgi:hypothetical protein
VRQKGGTDSSARPRRRKSERKAEDSARTPFREAHAAMPDGDADFSSPPPAAAWAVQNISPPPGHVSPPTVLPLPVSRNPPPPSRRSAPTFSPARTNTALSLPASMPPWTYAATRPWEELRLTSETAVTNCWWEPSILLAFLSWRLNLRQWQQLYVFLRIQETPELRLGSLN